jgi:hypothetical protein
VVGFLACGSNFLYLMDCGTLSAVSRDFDLGGIIESNLCNGQRCLGTIKRKIVEKLREMANVIEKGGETPSTRTP